MTLLAEPGWRTPPPAGRARRRVPPPHERLSDPAGPER